MAKAKGKKVTVAPEKPKQKPAVIKTKSDCESCKDQCLAGITYIQQFQKNKAYKGIPCKK